MEQRTRILHHTRSKTPIILSNTNDHPKKANSQSLAAQRRQKAPLASLDRELSALQRRQTKSRDGRGYRSSSTGRHEQGSRRIVSREVLKSDQISDWSDDDGDSVSSNRSIPIRRHTMGSLSQRPRLQSQESSDDQSTPSSSRTPSPSWRERTKDPCQRRAEDLNLAYNQANISNGLTVKPQSDNNKINDRIGPVSRSFDHGYNSPHMTSRNRSVATSSTPSAKIHDSPQIGYFRNVIPTNPSSYQSQVHIPPTSQPRPTCLSFQPVPMTLSSELSNRNNIISPVSSPEHSLSVSSYKQLISRQLPLSCVRASPSPSPSSNVRASTLPSSSSNVRTPTLPSPSSNVRSPTLPSPSSNVRTPTLPSPSSNVRTPPSPSPSSNVRTPTLPSPSSNVRTPTLPSPSSNVRAPTLPSSSSSIRSSTLPSPSSNVRKSTFAPPSPVASPSNSRTRSSRPSTLPSPSPATSPSDSRTRPLRTSTMSTPSPVTSPSDSRTRSSRSSTLPSSSSTFSNDPVSTWRTDPRRRPFQAGGDFALSPEDGPHRLSPDPIPRPHPFSERVTPTAASHGGVHTSSSPPQIVSPSLDTSTSRHCVNTKEREFCDNASSRSNRRSHITHVKDYDHTLAGNVNNGNNPRVSLSSGRVFSCLGQNEASHKCNDSELSNTRSESSHQTTAQKDPSSPYACLDNSSKPSLSNRTLRTQPDSHQHGIVNLPSPHQNQPGRSYDVNKTRHNHDRPDVEVRPYSNTLDSVSVRPSYSNDSRSVSVHSPYSKYSPDLQDSNYVPVYKDNNYFSSNTQRRNQMPDDSCRSINGNSNNQSRQTIPLSNKSSPLSNQRLEVIEPGFENRLGRNRDSFRMATGEGANLFDVCHSSESRSGSSEIDNRCADYSVGSISSRPSGSNFGGNDRMNQHIPHWDRYNDERYRNNTGNNMVDDISYTASNASHNVNDAVHQSIAQPFVRGSRQRDSYRIATSGNPDLTSDNHDDDIFNSCEDILASREIQATESSNPLTHGHSSLTRTHFVQKPSDNFNLLTSKGNASHQANMLLEPSSNIEISSRIKRNSLRLATASLSDLSVILDEIDIGELPYTPVPGIDDSIGNPSPVFIQRGPKLSPLAERSLGRSGSSASSRNSSSFGSFYSCQSKSLLSTTNSPIHTSSQHSSPSISKPGIKTPDSIHKLITSNAHDSGISQSSDDTNSFHISANTSIGSAEEVDWAMNHFPVGGSLNRKRPVFYWTRQSPYPRQTHNTIPASWKPREVIPSSKSTRYPTSGSIRSYGSSSSVESGSKKTNASKQRPLLGNRLQRYGCGLDGRNAMLCRQGSNESLPQRYVQDNHQNLDPRRISSASRQSFTLPIPVNRQYRPSNSEIEFDQFTRSQDPDLSPDLESPNADNLRSPPSLGRPRRKMYAGFDSQPLPMDSFMSDSSSIFSCSSRGTDISGQPDSGNFDDSFYSIDNRSLYDERVGCPFEVSLTQKDFMNLTEIRGNPDLCRSSSLYSTSTAKESEGQLSDEDDGERNVFQQGSNHPRIPFHLPHPSQTESWSGHNYNSNKHGASVATHIPVATFSV